MAYDIEQLLSLPKLMEVVEAVKSGLPNPLPSEFFSITEDMPGHMGRYFATKGQRRVARRVEYGAPALNREQKGFDSRDVKLLHSFEEMTLDPYVLVQLMSLDAYQNDMGAMETARQVREFTQLQHNLEIAAVAQVLANGAIYFNDDGNLLPSSSGAEFTIDFDVPAGNKNQLDWDGSGAIIGASWATATTNIPLDLREIDIAGTRLTGFPPWGVIYGRNVPEYFTQNNYVKDFFYRNMKMNPEYLNTGQVPDGLFNLRWFPGYTMFFEDETATFRSLVGDDTCIFFPKPDRNWWTFMRGTTPVPNSIDIQTSLQAAVAALTQAKGLFLYGRLLDNPCKIVLRGGNTFLPIVKNPDVLFIADVTP